MSPDEASRIAAGVRRRGLIRKQEATESDPDAALVVLGRKFEALSAELAILQREEVDGLSGGPTRRTVQGRSDDQSVG
jgi:hypothetical protein